MTDNMSCSDAIQKGRERMKQKLNILAAFIALVLMLTGCAAGDKAERPSGSSPDSETSDKAERLTESSPDSEASDKAERLAEASLDSEAGDKVQRFAEASPGSGEAFTGIMLNKPLEAGNYAAVLYYDCFS